MKQIENVTLWVDGQQVIADKLNLILSNDDLYSSATFTYMIGQETGNPITALKVFSSGVVNLNGQEYIDWDNSNDQAYQIVATKLNLTIL